MSRVFLYAYCRALQLRNEEQGLSMLGYAIGAAAVVVPLAILLIGFGDGAVEDATAAIDGTLP